MWNIWFTIFGIAFIFIMTALGAAVVFFFKGEISSKINAFFLGLASGVMIAACIWSLLLPSIQQAEIYFKNFAFMPAAIGLLLGGLFLVGLDIVVPILCKKEKTTGVCMRLSKPMRLFLAVTLHNIPEGLAVGFAFGAAATSGEWGAYTAAIGLAVGIGIQNFPEGLAVALPLKTTGSSRKRAFLWGAASGVAEPIFAVIGYFLATWLQILQPWLLAFSAGAMLFVAAEDLIPDTKINERTRIGAWGVLLGFILMMTLDVVFG